MASYILLTLDLTGPQGVGLTINSGDTYATNQVVTCAIACSDTDKTGYQIMFWGDVDGSYDTNVQPLEANSTWIAWSATKQIKLATGDGEKTLNVKVRDTVLNETSATDTIILNTTVPVVTISGVAQRISKMAGANTATFTFTSDVIFDEYKVKVVPATDSNDAAGTLIPTTGGSSNTSGAAGNYPASTTITVTIKGADLETASAGDGEKIVKVFVKNDAGLWSV